jgi:opacity protein-like surface antigen
VLKNFLTLLATSATVLVVAPAPAAALELELAGYGGVTFPFYEQSFSIDLRPPERPFPGVELRQERPLTLNGKGGLVLAGGATLYLTGGLGIEVRYDSADVDIGADAPVYSVRTSFPLPSFSATLEPAPTVISLSNLTPVSLNLKLRTGGPLRFVLSGGVSYLPDFQFAVTQPLNLRLSGISLPPGLDLGTINASAITRPEDPESSRFGGNVGLGLQIKISDNVALVGDARVFGFPKQVLEWQVTQRGGVVAVPPELLEALEAQLEPVRFNPAYFHLLGGIAFTF